MKLKTILRDVKRTFTFWKPIHKLPEWVEKAHVRWKMKLPTHPYNRTKHFVGKNNIYKIKHGMGSQGEAPVVSMNIKKRIN